MSSFSTIVFTLFFVMDALGAIPVYLNYVSPLPVKRQLWIGVRELLIALLVMIAFTYIGQWLLTLLGLSKTTVEVSGGIIIFLIAIRLIFPQEEDTNHITPGTEPFIVPIAIPLIAGPSLLAAIMIYSLEQQSNFRVISAVVVAWFASGIILLLSRPIHSLIKDKGLLACQRLMGLILALIAVQMFLHGFRGCLKIE